MLPDGSFGPLVSALAAALRQSGCDRCEEPLQGSNATANPPVVRIWLSDLHADLVGCGFRLSLIALR